VAAPRGLPTPNVPEIHIKTNNTTNKTQALKGVAWIPKQTFSSINMSFPMDQSWDTLLEAFHGNFCFPSQRIFQVAVLPTK